MINFSITLKFCEPFFRRKEISVHDYSAGMSHFGWSIVPVSDGNLTSFNRRNVSQTQAFEKFSEWGSTTQASLFWRFSFSTTVPNLKAQRLLLKMLLAMSVLGNVKDKNVSDICTVEIFVNFSKRQEKYLKPGVRLEVQLSCTKTRF